jgi:hypothetical protein
MVAEQLHPLPGIIKMSVYMIMASCSLNGTVSMPGMVPTDFLCCHEMQKCSFTQPNFCLNPLLFINTAWNPATCYSFSNHNSRQLYLMSEFHFSRAQRHLFGRRLPPLLHAEWSHCGESVPPRHREKRWQFPTTVFINVRTCLAVA